MNSFNVNETLAERGARYGDFAEHADITQGIKAAMQVGRNWASISTSQREALEMTAHKIGRILNGDPSYLDSWDDIVGYITLVTDQLRTPRKEPQYAKEASLVTRSVFIDSHRNGCGTAHADDSFSDSGNPGQREPESDSCLDFHRSVVDSLLRDAAAVQLATYDGKAKVAMLFFPDRLLMGPVAISDISPDDLAAVDMLVFEDRRVWQKKVGFIC